MAGRYELSGDYEASLLIQKQLRHAISSVLYSLPVGHGVGQQVIEALAVVVLFQMALLVEDDVINSLRRLLY